MDTLLPAGNVTLLFTDIEGSTALWEERPADMRLALERHDAILRDAIRSFDGRIVKTTGDGIVAVFDDAKNAVAASLVAQRALQAEARRSTHAAEAPGARATIALKVRMGLHSGIAHAREGDYFGASVNRAARIMAIAHGEQVLLSSATADLVRDLPEGVALHDLGEHRLKGLVDPERLLQLVAPGLRAEFPPLAPRAGHSLPAENDAFVGRNDALADLRQRFAARARLVSVFGTGGSGKTRLVVHFGWRALALFDGGAWFCDLSPARSVDGVLHAVAQGLDVPLGKDDPVDQIGRAIAGRGRCLVILDNFEQVALHAGSTLGRWLARAPHASFLVTTREVLGLPGEDVVPLAPLDEPDAVELFTRRAAAARPGFAPSGEDATAIARLVRLLDLLPLAIELAAARMQVMSPRSLHARMSERFKLLASASGRSDRQATLRAVFDWSWELLSLPEKAALAQLSVFEGGFTLEAAEAVVDLARYRDAPWPVDVLQSLVQKSLVRHAAHDRFDLLVSVQEYAAEHLRTDLRYEGSGAPALRAAEARHGAYFASLDDRAATAHGCAELDNLVAACRRAVARGDGGLAAMVLERAWAALKLRGPLGVTIDLASMVLAGSGLDAAALVRVHRVAGSALQACGRKEEATAHFEASLAHARAGHDRRGECRALLSLGFCSIDGGRPDASRAHLDAGRAIALDMQDHGLMSEASNALAVLAEFEGRLHDAKEHYAAGLATARASNGAYPVSHLLSNLGCLCADEGDVDMARSHLVAALADARECGDRRLEAVTLGNLGWLSRLEEDFDTALALVGLALDITRQIGLPHLECFLLINLGIACQRLQRPEEARHHFEVTLALARELGERRWEGQVLGYLGVMHAQSNDAARALDCLQRGEDLLRAISDRSSLALLLCNRAEAECIAKRPEAAMSAIAAAESLAAEAGLGAPSEPGRELARLRKQLLVLTTNPASS